MAPISATALEILRRRSEYAVMTPCCIVLPRCNRWVVGVNNTNLRDNLVTEAEFVDLVVSAPRLRELVMFDWGFATISPRNLERLAAANAFEYLEQWTIGWDGWLAMATFFDLLALMPNLKQLLIGRVAAADEDNLDDRDRAGSVTSVTSSDLDTSSTSQAATTRTRTPAHKFATPACSLEKLFVHDDWGIDFMEYPHLLSNSHHTLTHVEMHWIFDEEPGVQLAHALEKCINVRSLTFIGCNFKFGELLRICPRLVRLGMESMQSLFPEVWPPENDERTSSGSAAESGTGSENENQSDDADEDPEGSEGPLAAGAVEKLVTALPERLEEIVFWSCRGETGEEFIQQRWKDSLEHILSSLPHLQTIRMMNIRPLLYDDTLPTGQREAYLAMRRALRDRRIRLTMVDDNVM